MHRRDMKLWVKSLVGPTAGLLSHPRNLMLGCRARTSDNTCRPKINHLLYYNNHYSRPILCQCSGKAILVPTHALQDIESLGSGHGSGWLLLHGRFLYWDIVNDSPIWHTGWPATLCYYRTVTMVTTVELFVVCFIQGRISEGYSSCSYLGIWYANLHHKQVHFETESKASVHWSLWLQMELLVCVW